MNRWQIKALSRVVVVLLGCLCFGQVAQAQSETREPFIKLTSIKAKENDGKWIIKVQGKAPDVPKGTKVDFEMTWRSQLVQSFRQTLSSPGSFTVELKPKKAVASSEKFQIRTVIYVLDPIKTKKKVQSKAVQQEFDKKQDRFNPAAAPWTDYHFDLEFQLATQEEIAAELASIQEFFESRYVKLSEIDRDVRTKAKGVREGTEFTKNEKFQLDKWRKWFADDVVKEIISIQKEITEGHENKRFMPYRLPLALMTDLSAAIAKRALQQQKKLFKEKSAELKTEDKEHEGLDADPRTRRVSSRTLQRLVNEIQEHIGLGAEEEGGASDG